MSGENLIVLHATSRYALKLLEYRTAPTLTDDIPMIGSLTKIIS